MIEPIRNLFWHLPPELRRKLVAGLMRGKYKAFHNKCEREIKNPLGSTLRPFVDHKCIFVHIPKSAGLSVTNSLFGGITGSHMKIVEYQTMFCQQQFDQYFKFTFVRNPWDRAVSAFFYLKKGGMGEMNRNWAMRNLGSYSDFDTFVKQWVNQENIHSHSHFRPQYKFICLPGKRKPAVDFIGYFENLDADYSFIKKKIGVRAKLQTRNVTNERHRDYRQYYSEETKEIIANVYHEDIELFGYDFDNQMIEKVVTRRGRSGEPNISYC